MSNPNVAQVASNLKNFEKGFIAYAIDYGDFPNDCHTDSGPFGLPSTVMEAYLPVDAWSAETALGGRYKGKGQIGTRMPAYLLMA